MFDKKPWYMSKTIVIGIIVAALGIYGIEVDQDMWKTITENSDKVFELIAVAIIIYGRLTAKETLTLTKSTETISNYIPPSIPEPVAPVAVIPVAPVMPVEDDARG